jgi:hypothetical protein
VELRRDAIGREGIDQFANDKSRSEAKRSKLEWELFKTTTTKSAADNQTNEPPLTGTEHGQMLTVAQ